MCPQPWGSSPYRMNYACIESSFAWPAFPLLLPHTQGGRIVLATIVPACLSHRHGERKWVGDG
jgi:hypothetical protein